MEADDSSDLSSLSSLSPPPSDSESEVQLKEDTGILRFFHKLKKGEDDQTKPEPQPPTPRKREPSPPHEPVFADNPDIAFIVMFRNRFDEAFPRSLPTFGPQELERDLTDPFPGDRAEVFLCAILSLILNRKQDVKPGHYSRALEDAISSHKNQRASSWDDKSPLTGGATFSSMTPSDRLTLLRTLILWSMSSSESIRGIIAKAYKQNRHEDDLNQPLSVQPWGSDSDRRRYFLIEGRDNTSFRIYREGNPAGFKRTWISVADSVDSLKALADKLDTADGGPKAKKLANGMRLAVPRLEESDEKRRRREYRQKTKERFKRPEIGFSLYEGRTRGKRVKYTFSDDEDDDIYSDSTSTRRSARNTGTVTPAEPAGPVTTMSGRHIRPPTRLNPISAGDELDNGDSGEQFDDDANYQGELSLGPSGRPRRSAAAHHGRNGWASQDGVTRDSHADADDEMAENSDNGIDAGEDEDEHVPEDESDDEEDFNEDDYMLDEEDLVLPASQTLVVNLNVSSAQLKAALGANVMLSPKSESKESSLTSPLQVQSPQADTGAKDGPSSTAEELKPTPSGPKSHEIGQLTPEPTIDAKMAGTSSTVTPSSPPPPTALALRGSPEKPHAEIF